MSTLYRRLSYLVPILALIVMVKGAYVRLSDAGLGCPDWPGCYGKLVAPQSAAQLPAEAHPLVQKRPVESGKAWREMIHRYLASGLGFLILGLCASAWRDRRAPEQPLLAPALLVPLVVFQGLLGMWTVTLLLKPFIVTAHLIGGMSILALATWNLQAVRDAGRGPGTAHPGLAAAAGIALVCLAVQIFLGGWTSTNYAALACTDFPTCQGSFLPPADFEDAFVLWRGLGINYEFGVLDTPARTAIHLVHRYGALVTALVVLSVLAYALAAGDARCRRAAWCILALLALQLTLGIANVLRGLPLPVAVAHNGGAGLLLAGLVSLLYFARHEKGPRRGSPAR
ncbi:MAG: COX15/CtaA family protein [Gammaproteobacteria bacterium]|nr:COX15/CtaA family protein [Gammaproteobacteria bacterium]MBI5616344.1 COX15/CtaA family protein [Gammaproteobacteria bacterium]